MVHSPTRTEDLKSPALFRRWSPLHCRWVPITFGVEWAHWWGARREKTEAACELWPDPFACQGLPWIPECRELVLSVLVGAGLELPFV